MKPDRGIAAPACVDAAAATLCENKNVQVILGEIHDLSLPVPDQAADGALDPCTDAPLFNAGTALVLAGGNATRRVATLPGLLSGQRAMQRAMVVEWTDDGEGAPGAADAWKVLATDPA
jgi:hypothetical protein